MSIAPGNCARISFACCIGAGSFTGGKRASRFRQRCLRSKVLTGVTSVQPSLISNSAIRSRASLATEHAAGRRLRIWRSTSSSSLCGRPASSLEHSLNHSSGDEKRESTLASRFRTCRPAIVVRCAERCSLTTGDLVRAAGTAFCSSIFKEGLKTGVGLGEGVFL